MVCTIRMGGNDMRRPRPRTECQVCAYCINFSVHPRRLFLSSKCSSMVNLLGSSMYLRPGSSIEQRFLINTHHTYVISRIAVKYT